MSVAGARQIFGGAAEFHQYRRFVDHFTGLDADDVHAEHTIGLRICENLDETVGGLVDLGAAIGGERKFAGGVSHASLLQLLFGLADR